MSAAHIALMTGGAPPVWSPSMELKHLDVVRSDIDGDLYVLRNNNPISTPIAVGPGNPITAVAAWQAGWRKVGDSEVPGDLITIADRGNSAIITNGTKKYSRSGVLIDAVHSDYPLAPENLINPFKYWETTTVSEAISGTTAYAIGDVQIFSEGPFKGFGVFVSGAATTSVDATKTWTTQDFGASWTDYILWNTSSAFNRRITSNGKDRIYIVFNSETSFAYFYPRVLYERTSFAIEYKANHGLNMGATAGATSALEYVGRTGETADTDCVIFLYAINITDANQTSVTVSSDGCTTFSRPVLTVGLSQLKPVMALSNKQGHVLLMSAAKASGASYSKTKFWFNNNYVSGEWVVTFDSDVYYNVCGGCWDGEKYVIALESASGVDLFTGVIQAGGSVVFTKVSTVSLSSFITGDGHKNSGNGIYSYRDQYVVRMTNKLSIFPSLGALCSGLAYAPYQGATVLNSPAFCLAGDVAVGFNTKVPMFARSKLGDAGLFKNSPDTVLAVRIQ